MPRAVGQRPTDRKAGLARRTPRLKLRRPGGGRQVDVLRHYQKLDAPKVARGAFYAWFTEKLGILIPPYAPPAKVTHPAYRKEAEDLSLPLCVTSHAEAARGEAQQSTPFRPDFNRGYQLGQARGILQLPIDVGQLFGPGVGAPWGGQGQVANAGRAHFSDLAERLIEERGADPAINLTFTHQNVTLNRSKTKEICRAFPFRAEA